MNPNIQNGMNPQLNGQSMPTTPVQPAQPTPNAVPQGYVQNPYAQGYYQQPTQPAPQPMPQAYQQPQQTPIDPMAAVTNLNKEEAMEEALSHTTQYSPFQAQVVEIKPELEQANNKKAYIVIGIIVAIIALFIIFLPQISNLFGW